MGYKTDQDKWVADFPYEDPNGAGIGECKYWVDNSIIQPALGVDLPSNNNNGYQWIGADNSTIVTSQTSHLDGTIEDVIRSNTISVQAGDMIQMYNSEQQYPHTVIIGKIDSYGIWVFDSNYVGIHTPGYHKISFNSLNTYDLFTIYRIK